MYIRPLNTTRITDIAKTFRCIVIFDGLSVRFYSNQNISDILARRLRNTQSHVWGRLHPHIWISRKTTILPPSLHLDHTYMISSLKAHSQLYKNLYRFHDSIWNHVFNMNLLSTGFSSIFFPSFIHILILFFTSVALKKIWLPTFETRLEDSFGKRFFLLHKKHNLKPIHAEWEESTLQASNLSPQTGLYRRSKSFNQR